MLSCKLKGYSQEGVKFSINSISKFMIKRGKAVEYREKKGCNLIIEILVQRNCV